MHTALDVAKFIIGYSKHKNYSISNLKLQKILYFIQSDYIANKSQLCFKDKIEAWDFGPVISSIYNKYKIYGSAEIPNEEYESAIKELSDEDIKRISAMIDMCSKYSASKLVTITHKQEPWRNAYKQYENNEITPRAIKEYYERRNQSLNRSARTQST